jgi:hypothetical protein
MKNYFKIALILFLVFSVHTFYGQPPPPDGGGGPGTVPDVLPINILVYPFLVIGAYLGYVFTKKSSK